MSFNPLNAVVAPKIEFIPSERSCDRSSILIAFSDATHFILNLIANDVPSPVFGVPVIARVEVVTFNGNIPWVFETNQFILEEEVQVELNILASTLGNAPFSGSARLSFSEGRFTWFTEATLQGVPDLPPTNGAIAIHVNYVLIIDDVIPIKQYNNIVMHVDVIPQTETPEQASFGYTMDASTLLGSLTIPNFFFPFGTTIARGNVALSGAGFSLDWPLFFTVDPFQNTFGETLYPANLQETTGLAANFSGDVSSICCPIISSLNLAFEGFTTASNSGGLLVPNYVPSITGGIRITGEV